MYEPVKQSECPLVRGQKTVLKHVVLKQTKHVYLKLKQNAPDMRIFPLFFFSVSSPWRVRLCLCNWKQITDIYFGDTTVMFKSVLFFSPIRSSCTRLAVCRLFFFSASKQKSRTPQKHSLKTLQQHFKRRGDRNRASNRLFLKYRLQLYSIHC